MPFQDRSDAARKLALRLQGYKDRHPLLLAIPRGGVPLAAIVATELNGDLDVVLVRKIGAPSNPDLAIGAVDEYGWRFVSEIAAQAGADSAYLERETRRQRELLRVRQEKYRALRPAQDPAGRIVIVIDDGLATGATMIAALHAVRARHPARLIAAIPVAPPDSLLKLEPLADETVCIEVTEAFGSVSQFYVEFPQVEDRQVLDLLRAAAR